MSIELSHANWSFDSKTQHGVYRGGVNARPGSNGANGAAPHQRYRCASVVAYN
jgi:hypothetical protein